MTFVKDEDRSAMLVINLLPPTCGQAIARPPRRATSYLNKVTERNDFYEQPILLACEVAEFRLRDEWNMAALQRAFGEEVDQVMANTWRLCGDTINPELEALYALFDKAGMAKTQQAAAVWKAAQRFYYQQVLAMVNFENQSFKQRSIEDAADEVAAAAEGTD